MLESNTPIGPWCFCYRYTADIICLCATGCFEFQGWTPYEKVMNYTPYISKYASFSWFQWSWFYGESLKIKQLCVWLGPARGVGKSFLYYILTYTGLFITLSSVIPIDEHELITDHMTKQCKNFMERVEAKIGNARKYLLNRTYPYRVY